MKRIVISLLIFLISMSAFAQVENAEIYLKYRWKNVPASAYLQFAKNGDAEVFKGLTENMDALRVLIEAESAEKKGRYVPQIINGIYYFSNMSAWVNPVIDGEYACVIPDPANPPITKTSTEVAKLLTLALARFEDPLNDADPMIAIIARRAIEAKSKVK